MIATALYGRADFLLTEDQDLQTNTLIELFKQVGLEIATIDRFIMLLDEI